jgi:threonine dehydratase
MARGVEAVLLLTLAIGPRDVFDARERLHDVAIRTPVIEHALFHDRVGAEVFCKAENRQLTGSFKIRGAYNAASRLAPEQLAHGLIAISSGNHAQAVAKSAQLLGTTAVIAMPEDSSPLKRKATEALGATVVTFDRFARDREDVLRELLAGSDRAFIPPYDHPHVIAGQGTAALELLEDVERLDVLVVPVSGGGLIAGSATIAKHLDPSIQVVGVEPEAANDTQRSLAAGERVWIEAPVTIADGLRTQIPGELTFEINRRLVDDLVTVTDDEIRDAMAFLQLEASEVVEPSGAVGIAALFSGRLKVRGLKVGVILSGGNVEQG